MGLDFTPSENSVLLSNPADPNLVMPDLDLPDLGERVAAIFQRENTVVSLFRNINREQLGEDEERDDDFNPFDHLRPEEELLRDQFLEARSLKDMEIVRERIVRANGLQQVIGQGGGFSNFIITTFAVVADPTSFLPIAGVANKARTGTRLLASGFLGAAEVGISESILQATQDDRTPEETIAAMLMGGVFGLGLAGAGVGLAARKNARIGKSYDEAVNDTTNVIRASFPDDVGAAASPRPFDTSEASRLAFSFGLATVLNKLAKIGLGAPGLEMAMGKLRFVRETAHQLFDIGISTKGNLGFSANPRNLQTSVKGYDIVKATLAKSLEIAYADFRKTGGTKLSRTQFYEEVGRSLRRGDVSEIPSVAQAAKKLREVIFEPMKGQAVLAKLLGEGIEPRAALSYFMRDYNVELLKSVQGGRDFKSIVERWLRDTIDPSELAADAEYALLAQEHLDNILLGTRGKIDFHTIGGPQRRGPTKERALLVPDELLEPFLNDNALDVGLKFITTLAADIESVRIFGQADPTESLVAKLFEEAEAAAALEKNAKKAQALLDEARRVAPLIEKSLKVARGISLSPADARMEGMRGTLQIFRDLNFTRLLGGVTITSTVDVGRIGMEEGMLNLFGLVIRDSMTGFKGIRMALQEGQAAGTALDVMMGSRIKAMNDLGEGFEDASTLGKARRLSKGVADNFAKFTLINRWNSTLKAVTSTLVSTRVLAAAKNLAEGKALTKRDIRKLARSGMSEEQLGRIGEQLEHFESIGGATYANTAAWTDPQAVEAFRNTLLSDVDNTIITPGVGDAPIWTSTEWGKTVFQFKRFAWASNQRVLIAGAQNLAQGDLRTLTGMSFMVGMGMMSVGMRDFSKSGEIRERSPEQWIAEGVDRSGILSIYFEGDALLSKAIGTSPIVAATGQEVSRLAEREALSQLLGPTAGIVPDAFAALRGIAAGEITQPDLHRIRRLSPAQNLFYLDWINSLVEQGISSAFDLPERQTRRQ